MFFVAGHGMGVANIKKANRLDYIQVCRGVAAISVVLYHTNITLGLPKFLGRDVFAFFNGGHSGVELFFVLSGFIISYAHARDIGRLDRLSRYAIRRAIRLIPALWITLLIVMLIFAFSSATAPEDVFQMHSLASDFFLLPAERNVHLAVEWTLRYEAFFYVVFMMFFLGRQIGAVVTFLCLVASAIATLSPLPFPLNKLFTIYNFLFLFGYFAFTLGAKLQSRQALISVGAGFIVFFSTWTVEALGHFRLRAEFSILLFGVGAALFIAGLFALESRGDARRAPSVVVLLGAASYSIYLVHFPIVSALGKAMATAQQRIGFPDVIAFVVVSLSAVAGGLLFYLFVERPIANYARKYLRT